MGSDTFLLAVVSGVAYDGGVGDDLCVVFYCYYCYCADRCVLSGFGNVLDDQVAAAALVVHSIVLGADICDGVCDDGDECGMN